MNAQEKTSVLNSLARLLAENKSAILSANAADLADCVGDDPVIVDRLKLDDKKVDGMAASVAALAARPDPAAEPISVFTRDDGLRIENRKVPFGTVLIIYEARPDVTIEAAAIAVKAGNKILLKGGKEARNTNLFLTGLWHRALKENGFDEKFVRYLDISREETRQLISGALNDSEKFDLVIPRGGDALIDFVVTHSKAPVIVSGRGNNFLYIDRDADIEKAIAIAVNGKQRLSVCNALDKVLINKELPDLVPRIQHLIDAMRKNGIDVFADGDIRDIDRQLEPVSAEMWSEEFLSAKIALGVVDNLNAAVTRINQYSGGHSAAIVTENDQTAAEFLEQVDCAAVYHNASVRFTDGGEFGLGAEIAISTQKMHFRGPLGAEHLMTNKWFVYGNGQVRK